MNRRGLLMKVREAAAALLVLRVAQGAPVAPRNTCPVCGADQTGKAWYAGPQDAEGHSPAVCWGCRAETVSSWPFDPSVAEAIYRVDPADTPFAAAAKEAAERGKPVRSVRVYQADLKA